MRRGDSSKWQRWTASNSLERWELTATNCSVAFANELLEMIERVPASSCNQVVKSCLSQTFIVMSNAFADAVP